MKNMKNGFSLAEVLIAVTIAAIIGTLGFTIAKKGIARAYDRYVYTGYYALDIALKDANFFVKDGESEAMQLYECFANGNVAADSIEDPEAENTCYFTQRLYDVLDGYDRSIPSGGNGLEFTVPNGIKYSITLVGLLNRPDLDPNSNPKPRNTYRIVMTVPSVKTRNGSERRVCLWYVENHQYIPRAQAINANVQQSIDNFLVPYYNPAFCPTQEFTADSFIQDIHTRIDLLPFYIETEETGKVVNGVYVPRRFHNARQVYCTITGNISPFLMNCSAADIQRVNGNIEDGVLRVTDPRRL